VCAVDVLEAERGVAALLGGHQVALIRVVDELGDRVYAIDNRDPACGANVLARGILGAVEGRWYVASPMYKHRYALDDGSCLTDPDLRVRVHAVEVRARGVVVTIQR
jgi:NAD(P)H-dependent nitrite reductase small subunit